MGTIQSGEKMKPTRFIIAAVLALASTLPLAATTQTAAAPNPRPGNGAKTPLDPAALQNGVRQVTAKLGTAVAANAKATTAANAAFANWETALGKPGFFKLDATQKDPNWPYAQVPGINIVFTRDGFVPAHALARPTLSPCHEYESQCTPSPDGVAVTIYIDRDRLASTTPEVLTRALTRELGRALGLEYAKEPINCELMITPNAPLPAGCTRPAKPTAPEITAVKNIYGLP
ncbi:hypothetical protein [Streptomyces sp. NPDC088789]|uniref:hypothetical protein n=1 Tax=Streptomyces sp. NPDC088789 TaxID=3365899 RepID=UPI00382AF132